MAGKPSDILGAGSGTLRDFGPVSLEARYGDPGVEYEVVRGAAGLADRSQRGLLEIMGDDRAGWLHNLTTHNINALGKGDGHYGFCLNVQGRILFDLNAMVTRDRIWLDLDRRFLEVALAHLGKYCIMEDVTIKDRTHEYARLGVCGPRASSIVRTTCPQSPATMASLQLFPFELDSRPALLFRNPFCGNEGYELAVARECVHSVVESALLAGATRIGADTQDIIRIESGMPWPVSEIHDDVLPAETGQMNRAVSSNKGCYLGQEVVERMRARGAVAKKLFGLTMDAQETPVTPVELMADDGKAVGTMTSAAVSVARGVVLALGYVKSAHAIAGARLAVADSTHQVTTSDLPFVPNMLSE